MSAAKGNMEPRAGLDPATYRCLAPWYEAIAFGQTLPAELPGPRTPSRWTSYIACREFGSSRIALPIVGVSGIRGIVGGDLTAAYLLDTAARLASYFAGQQVALARDTRTSSPWVQQLVESAFLHSGCDIIDTGVGSTPGLLHYVRYHDLAGGVMITASHNPGSWNGLKIVLKDGRLPFADELAQVLSRNHPVGIRRSRRVADTNDYPAALAGKLAKVQATGKTAVVDSGGGVVGSFLPPVLQTLGYQASWLFDAPGVFTRNPDPTVDALLPLRALVRHLGADAGLAFDPDGDRLVVVDGAGSILGPDLTVLLAVRRLLQFTSPHAAVVSVDSSQAISQFLRARGLTVHTAPVGEPNVVRAMLLAGAELGVEGSSGGLIWNDFVLGRDGALAAGLILQLLADGGDLDSLVKEWPRFYQTRLKVDCPRAEAPRLLQGLHEEHPGAEHVDGFKIWLSSSAWVLLRASNTEDVLRVSAEASAPEEAQSTAEEWARVVNRRSARR